MWDIAEDKNSIKLIESFLAAGKPVALVCHTPGALRHVKTPAGKPLVEGKNVTGLTNGEEEEVGLTKVVPFLVEDELMSLGATFSKVKNWGVHTIADGQLITGQNPADSLRANRNAEQGEIARPLTSGCGHAAEIVVRVWGGRFRSTPPGRAPQQKSATHVRSGSSASYGPARDARGMSAMPRAPRRREPSVEEDSIRKVVDWSGS
jgi:hypothetical protein